MKPWLRKHSNSSKKPMSLKFLAVGQSFLGVRDEKSPYELRKENRLPKLDVSPRFKEVEKSMVQTDWLQSPPPQPIAAPPNPSPFAEQAAARPQPAPKAKRRWFSFLKLKWFRTTKPKNDFVQAELSLSKVQVVRNDLADSDLELVWKRKKKTKPVFSAVQQNEQLPRQGWSELTARLFEIGQK